MVNPVTMRALVIDDEELARKRVVNLLEDVPEIEVIGECSNGKTAIKQINELKPELIFLDINMKDMNGFDVLQKIVISPKPIVIFVTAYDNYASRAFDVDAFDFLLKPFKDQRFTKTIDKVLQISKSEADRNFEKRIKELFKIYSRESGAGAAPLKIPVKQGNKTILIDPATFIISLLRDIMRKFLPGAKNMCSANPLIISRNYWMTIFSSGCTGPPSLISTMSKKLSILIILKLMRE